MDRLFALQLLRAVFDQHRSLDEALDRLSGDSRDRAAAHRLAATVLRRAGTLDAILEPHLKRAPPDAVRLILRLGAAQLLLLDTPPHAAVATSVALARAQKLAPFAGLVNAVLRRVAEGGAAAMQGLDSPRLDTPGWLWASWGADARAIAAAHQHEAALDLTMMPGAMLPDGGLMLPTGSVRMPAGVRVTDLPGLAAGDFWVQDAAAALPARLLAARPGERVADLCAAPGGKTAQLAAAGATVIAVESNERRLPRLRENLDRLKLAAEIVVADAAVWRPDALLDAVLLDAPCSATGTIRRHPDLPHVRRPQDLAALTAAQDRLIEAAGADWLHLDVMDGHFVPNISFGPVVLKALRKRTQLPFDVHLMIAPADPYLAAFAEAGADHILVHAEAGPHIHRSLQAIRGLGKKAGLVLNPGTPAAHAAPVLELVDILLVMSVNPGFGGQSFLHSQLPKIAELRAMIDAGGRDIRLEVDGGVDGQTAPLCIAAGADTFVAGTAVFAAPDYRTAIGAVRGKPGA